MARLHRLVFASVSTGVLACGPAIRPAPPPNAPAPDSAASALQTNAHDSRVASDSGSGVALALDTIRLSDELRAAIDSATAALGIEVKRDSVQPAPPPSAVSSEVTVADSLSAEEGEGVEEVSWDIDVRSYMTHDRVARYVNLFAGPAKDRIQARLQRGKRYEGMIRQKFRERGIPEDMYYLALVESGYDNHAYSRAAAVGMWQFMSSTGRGMGLKIDWWVDERRDPMRATDAAARFLNSLQRQFGSYYLAAAAYNGGPGRVSRGLARFQEELSDIVGDDKFFALADQKYLTSETKNYVPQLIAAALIGKEPHRYGMTLQEVEPFAYDSVTVDPQTPLSAVAAAIAVPVGTVRDLNPHLLRGVTPPDRSYAVRVPVGLHSDFAVKYDSLPTTQRTAFTRVVTRKGQTLATLAGEHGVAARTISWYNRRIAQSRRGVLTAGQTLLIPTAAVIAGARDVPDPSIERYGPASAARGRVVHVVRRGESLGSIAKRYRTTVGALTRANGLKRTVVYPGQSIFIRRTTTTRSRTTVARRPMVKKPTTKKAAPQRRATTAQR